MKKTWSGGIIVAAVLLLAGILGVVAAQQALAQAKGPADFEFAGGNQGKVVFSHGAHAGKHPKCTDCHTKIYKMTKGQRSAPKMADMEKGQSCGSCHNGQAAFGVKEQASCAKCHKKA